ncbi:MAG: hypothetical protein U0790_18295 [Isosphaeraceae bacterium]
MSAATQSTGPRPPVLPDRPIGTVLDARFPQPGRYSEYGVPEPVRPAAGALYRAILSCPEVNEESRIVETALLRLLAPWSQR